jgi:hypothetical protein
MGNRGGLGANVCIIVCSGAGLKTDYLYETVAYDGLEVVIVPTISFKKLILRFKKACTSTGFFYVCWLSKNTIS